MAGSALVRMGGGIKDGDEDYVNSRIEVFGTEIKVSV